jgi:dTMP kinase
METNELFTLRAGKIVVLEGLDKTGKSTQLDLLKKSVDPTSALFAHMPSGFTAFTNSVYEAMESSPNSPISALARQLAHLSCHVESIPSLLAAQRSRGIFLDRWWWSTIAYGIHGGALRGSGVSDEMFRALVDAIWAPIVPDLVFVFLKPHDVDANNRDSVAAGYEYLMTKQREVSVAVPSMEPVKVQEFLISEMASRGLLGDQGSKENAR